MPLPGLADRGKVTARYTVRVNSTTSLECVRVHFFPSHTVAHYSLAEFRCLFKGEE